jgi:hypothetical protein
VRCATLSGVERPAAGVELSSLLTDHEWRVASAVGRGATTAAAIALGLHERFVGTGAG